MTDSNNPVEGTASLSAEEADSKIAALLGFEPDDGETAPAVEAEVPSHEEAEATEEHPETDSTEEEQPTEDVESEVSSELTLSEEAEYLVKGERIKGKDLEAGYMRHADYTRKTQELAQQRQQTESQVRYELTAQATQYLAQVEQKLIDHFPQEPNWLELAQDNPAQYAVEREAWNKRHADLNGVRHMRQQQEQTQQAYQQAAAAQAQARAFDDLVQMHPEFARNAEGKISTVATDLVSFAIQEVGLSEQLLHQVDDARIFSILYDAMRYRRQEAQKSKTI
ncbi:hypothetical protein MKK50_15195 [Methylobacterium sp. J-043]|nr:hypothetical protein [Methylobacterium sp. J-043]